MKLWIIVDSVPDINELLRLKIEVQKAFEILAFINSLNAEIKTFYELKNAKIQELEEEVDWKRRIKPENMEEYIKYIEDLKNKEIDVNPPKINKSELKWEIQIGVLMILDFLFE